MRVPLHIVCAQCGAVKAVRSRSQQQRQRFCSRRCAGVRHAERFLTRAHRQLGAERSKVVRRARWLTQVQGLSPAAIYRRAYSVGWKAGARSVRRRMGEAC